MRISIDCGDPGFVGNALAGTIGFDVLLDRRLFQAGKVITADSAMGLIVYMPYVGAEGAKVLDLTRVVTARGDVMIIPAPEFVSRH